MFIESGYAHHLESNAKFQTTFSSLLECIFIIIIIIITSTCSVQIYTYNRRPCSSENIKTFNKNQL